MCVVLVYNCCFTASGDVTTAAVSQQRNEFRRELELNHRSRFVARTKRYKIKLENAHKTPNNNIKQKQQHQVRVVTLIIYSVYIYIILTHTKKKRIKNKINRAVFPLSKENVYNQMTMMMMSSQLCFRAL